MEFLKALFESGALTYDQFTAKAKEAGINVANIADGAYVSRAKFNDTVNGLKTQVTDLQGQIAQRDTDLAGLNDKLTSAQADAGHLTEAQNALAALQQKYDNDSKEWAAKNARQAYEYAVKTAAGKEKFSSASARKQFIAEAIKQDFKMDGDTLMGYSDFLTKYRADDPGAFVTDEPAEPTPKDPAPTIVLPGKSTPPAKTMSLSEAMRRKNENPDFKVSFD